MLQPHSELPEYLGLTSMTALLRRENAEIGEGARGKKGVEGRKVEQG